MDDGFGGHPGMKMLVEGYPAYPGLFPQVDKPEDRELLARAYAMIHENVFTRASWERNQFIWLIAPVAEVIDVDKNDISRLVQTEKFTETEGMLLRNKRKELPNRVCVLIITDTGARTESNDVKELPRMTFIFNNQGRCLFAVGHNLGVYENSIQIVGISGDKRTEDLTDEIIPKQFD